MVRIVVTGVGATTPLAGTAPESWDALLAGRSGVRTLPYDWVEKYELPVHFAGVAAVEPAEVLTRVETRRLDRSAQFALVSAREAWQDAGAPDAEPERLAIDYATGIGGVTTLLNAWDTLREKGARRVPPLTVPMLMPNASAAHLSMEFKAQAGARTVASACASSVESLVEAYWHLQNGLADVIIAGGTEATLHPLPMAAFAALHALSKDNDDPAGASRPLDQTRDGFVLGEGAGTLVLETLEHARARGARIYAELLGGAVSADAYHITAPEPAGLGASAALRETLQVAGLEPDDVDHVNLHATSTSLGDKAEYQALERVFGAEKLQHMPVSATKGSTGHLLGGTGAMEAIFTIQALRAHVAPPTRNYVHPDPEIPFLASEQPQPLAAAADRPLVALSNSFGFGGHNAVVALREWMG